MLQYIYSTLIDIAPGTKFYTKLHFRMGLLDFEVIPVEHEKSGEGGWDSVVVVCENREWPSFTDPAFEHIRQTIEDAIKVKLYGKYWQV